METRAQMSYSRAGVRAPVRRILGFVLRPSIVGALYMIAQAARAAVFNVQDDQSLGDASQAREIHDFIYGQFGKELTRIALAIGASALIIGAALGALVYLSSHYGAAAYAGWSALVLVVLSGIALAFKRRDRWVAAGIFGFASVIAWAAFVGALWVWFGWLNGTSLASSFAGFSVARLSFELLVLAAVVDDMRRYRFPFIAAVGVFVGWIFVTDLLSGGGNWSAVVTLVVGLVYFAVGSASDKPSAFWFHVAAGALIGGSFIYWSDSGDMSWALISVASLVFILIADRTHRSSWAVFGTFGFFAAAAHFSTEWAGGTLSFSPSVVSSFRGWVPSLVFAFVGFLLAALGLKARRRNPDAEPLAPA